MERSQGIHPAERREAGPQRIIYLLCPAALRTGGPEAMHQLAGELIAQGHDARIVYVNDQSCNAILGYPAEMLVSNRFSFAEIVNAMPDAYAVYGTRAALEIIDEPQNALIIPEALPFLYRLGTRLRKCLWWLSVDNAMGVLDMIGGMDRVKQLPFIHLCQSTYAEDFLRGHGLHETWRLYDYTRAEFLEPVAPGPRVDRVLFNPKKGRPVVERLIAAAPDLNWTPIQGMTPEQVRELLRRSKVYIDFGEHPGKDRIPREAAVSGCCVISGKRGAADYFHDLPIPAAYKFGETDADIPHIIACIRACLADYARHVPAYDYYRRCIRTERDEFSLQVRRIFG
jgi:hypothetical protein